MSALSTAEGTRPRYGDARRPWHPDFVEYMYRILEHPAYARMPCTVDDAGKIDWTIPSNRPRGSKNWDGNARRRDWWRAKAREIGVPFEGKWLSRTAKAIHPFGEKPCQTCGRVMRIAYAYPTKRLIDRLNTYLPDDALLEQSDLLEIGEVVEHLVRELGEPAAAAALADVFPALRDAREASVDDLRRLVDQRVVAAEARGLLSPGAMSNAPDRLDGFHTYNLCCRTRHDTGRTSDNLRTYGADRRAFEHWCEGDWSAANYLMTQPGIGRCPRCGAVGQLTADHVGPISLGFVHSPHFEAVCLACNSSKNNRMSLADVRRLLELEDAGEKVVSWQARTLWDACKSDVASDEQALLLSKLLRVNQHHYLLLLHQATERGLPDVLLQFLSPQHAEYRTRLEDLDPTTLQYSSITRTPRQPTYARSHGARMVRIAFGALDDYASKAKRNVQYVQEDLLAEAQRHVDEALGRAARDDASWRDELVEILALEPAAQDVRLSHLFEHGYQPPEDFSHVREAFEGYMSSLADILKRRFAEGRSQRIGDELDDALTALSA